MNKFYVEKDRDHQRAIDLIDHSVDAYERWDINAIRRRRYRQGDQWTEEERRVLNARDEPIITDNLIHDKVTSLQGMEQQQRTDPRAFPRNPNNDEGARVASNALRYVEEVNRLDQQYTRCGEFLAVEGTAAIEFSLDKKSDPESPDIVARTLHYDRLVLDPHSRELDYADQQFIGYARWMDFDEAEQEYGKEKAKALTAYEEGTSESVRDESREDFWLDRKRKRVRIVKLYYKKGGQIYHCELQRAAFVTEPALSPYVDDKGRQYFPVVARSAYIKDTNERYGEVERYIDPQNEANKRRSKSLHLLNSTLIIAEENAFEDEDDARAEVKKPDGFLRVNSGYIDGVRVERNLDLSTGHQNLLMLTLSRFDDTGPNAALSGTENASGRSLQVQQQAGSMRLGPHFDAIDDMKLRSYRIIWFLIKQFWTAEKWIRIQGDDAQKEQKFAALNENVIDPATGQVTVKNSVAEIDVDIVIGAQPDTMTLRSEQADRLFGLAEKGIIPPKHAIMASDLTAKQEILDDMTGQSDSPEAQAAAQLQQQVQQMQVAMQEQELKLRQLDVALKGAQVDKTAAETEMKRAEIAETRANTEKIEVETAGDLLMPR